MNLSAVKFCSKCNFFSSLWFGFLCNTICRGQYAMYTTDHLLTTPPPKRQLWAWLTLLNLSWPNRTLKILLQWVPWSIEKQMLPELPFQPTISRNQGNTSEHSVQADCSSKWLFWQWGNSLQSAGRQFRNVFHFKPGSLSIFSGKTKGYRAPLSQKLAFSKALSCRTARYRGESPL